MKCSKCKSEPPEGAKFCNECGNKLEVICPKCNRINPPGSKFCNECGQNMAEPSKPTPKELSFDEKLKKIQRYLPESLTEKILSQRDKIEGERKQVTVMFCDMVGYTSLSEKIGPEEAYWIMDQVFELLIQKVYEFGGTVNDLTGDGLMALFGAPIALEDAPQRAVRVGMSIHKEISKFNEKLKLEKENSPNLKMRVGIHTGPVVVGTLGNDLHVEFTAIGDTVNLASRLESIAEPSTTYVSEDIFKITEGLFRFEAIGEKTIKGKKDPVKVYQVISNSSRRTRFDVSAERGLIPFVGRDRELDLLLDGFERAKSGRGQAFSIVAEAGLGKSRLLYEFRKAVSNEDITFLEGKCLSYSRGFVYHPVIDILKSAFNLVESDDDNVIREKVKQGLEILKADEASTLPYLLELLSVKDSGIDKIAMSPEAKKDRIMFAARQITLKGSEIQPLIVAIEDLHWIDRSSEEYLKTLFESISGARVLLILTYRPEYMLTWGGKSYHSQVNLNRLSNRESLAMVFHLLGTDDIDREIEELVLEKTEGVPFFVEEFVRSLKDLKVIEEKKKQYHLIKDLKDAAIPTTIQEVIMTRVDSLSEDAKDLLQIGSAIEREFSYELIKMASDLEEKELLSRLSVLKDSELIYERGLYPQSVYIFKHALTQEVVYDSILRKRKKQLHDAIGTAIEKVYKENTNEHYEILSEHFLKSENYEKSAEYSKRASSAALKKSAFKDAISYSKKCIDCLERLPQTDAVLRRIIDTRASLSIYYTSLNSHFEAMEAVKPIVDLAVKMDYQKRLPRIFAATGSYSLYSEEDLPKAIKELKKTIELSEKIGDFLSLWFGCLNLGAALSIECEFENSLDYFKKTIDLSIAGNNVVGISTAKNTLAWWNYSFQGKINLAFETTKEALHLAKETNDIFIKGTTYTTHGSTLYFKGFLEEAEHYLYDALDLCEKNSFLFWGANAAAFLGYVYYERGDYEKARSYFGKAFSFLKKDKAMPSMLGFGPIFTAKTKTRQHDVDIDLNELYSYAYKNKLKIYDGWFSRFIAEILMNIDWKPQSDAEHWINRAIEFDGKRGLRWQLAMDHAVYADLYRKNNNAEKVKDNLNKAIEIFKECGADGWVKKYENELTRL